MLDDKEIKKLSDATEEAFKERFEKLGYEVKILDRSGQNPRPDFLVSNSAGPQLICEVKTIVSAGFRPDEREGGIHISMYDKNLEELGVFQNKLDPRKIDDRLKETRRKRAALVADEPQYAEPPLLVGFDFDFFADYMLFWTFEEHCERFREVSGILTIAVNVERKKAIEKLSENEQERRARAEFGGDGHVNDNLPPRSKDFVLTPNQAALRPVLEDFAALCRSDD